MTKYKAVEKAIQEAIQCEHNWFDNSLKNISICEKCGIDYRNKEILGRPITLEDVLRALNKLHKGFGYVIRDDGTILKDETEYAGVGKFDEHLEKVATWDLGKPLSEQSKELHEFLWDLLVKK